MDVEKIYKEGIFSLQEAWKCRLSSPESLLYNNNGGCKMGYQKYVREAWKRPKNNKDLWMERLISWRKGPSTVRIERPTRIDRARSLGYRAKQGYVVVRQRVPRGGHVRPGQHKGRRPRTQRRYLALDLNYQLIAEQRAAKQFPNCEVLNSYFTAKDGTYYWYEVLLVDKASPSVKADKRTKWINDKQHRRRVTRGLTSAGKKSRGLRSKGKGAEKLRPSRAAVFRKKIKKPRK